MRETDYSKLNTDENETEEQFLQRVYDSRFSAYYIKSDYLKYYKPVLYFFSAKYQTSEKVIEALLFLYSERRFTKRRYKEYETSYNVSKNIFATLRRRGFVKVFLRRQSEAFHVYCLTTISKNIVMYIYDMLEGKNLPMSFFSDTPLIKKKYEKIKAKKMGNLLQEIAIWASADMQMKDTINNERVKKNLRQTANFRSSDRPVKERTPVYKVKIIEGYNDPTPPPQYLADE